MIKKIYEYIMDNVPGSELRRCDSVSWKGTRCVKHLNHWFRHEDAWRYKWRILIQCKSLFRYDCTSEKVMMCILRKNHFGRHESDMGFKSEVLK